jgi:hypothetical protein
MLQFHYLVVEFLNEFELVEESDVEVEEGVFVYW